MWKGISAFLSNHAQCSLVCSQTRLKALSWCAEGELQDWALDSVGLFVWIVIGAIAVFGVKQLWVWWQSLQEELKQPRGSLSKEDLFTL